MLNNKDLKILIELRKNSRAQLTEISRNTGIPISTIYDRLRSSTKMIVRRYVCLMNFDVLGFNTRAQICLKCGKNAKKELYDFLSSNPNVNSLYKINNGFDFMIEVIFRNVKDLEEFLEMLEERFPIKTHQTYYIIEDIFRENFFTNELYLNAIKRDQISKTFIY